MPGSVVEEWSRVVYGGGEGGGQLAASRGPLDSWRRLAGISKDWMELRMATPMF